MAEAILTGAAANIFSSLVSCAIQHIGLPCRVRRKLRKMKTNMSTIKDLLLYAQVLQIRNQTVEEWKGILDDAEKLLKKVPTGTTRTQEESLMRKVRRFFTGSNRKIRDIRKRLDKIVSSHFVEKLVERLNQINRREETSSCVNPRTVFGRDDNKKQLVDLLSSGDQEEVAIIPIVGMGGLGKTTLAQLVYNDDRIQKHFTKRLWVWIPNDFDIRRILIQLLQAGDPNGNTSYDNEGLELLQNRVRSLLCGHKFLLFLDDVWNEDLVKWKKLEDLLTTQAIGGSRIVVTTRSEMVASIVTTRAVEPYKLGGLQVDDCLKILVKLAFKEGDESNHPNLVPIGREIVEKCGGVPLAAEFLGAKLFSKTNEPDWLSVKDSGC